MTGKRGKTRPAAVRAAELQEKMERLQRAALLEAIQNDPESAATLAPFQESLDNLQKTVNDMRRYIKDGDEKVATFLERAEQWKNRKIESTENLPEMLERLEDAKEAYNATLDSLVQAAKGDNAALEA